MNEITENKKPVGLKAIINSDSMREQFSRALPKHLSVERFTRIALTALSRTPKLLDCTEVSMMKCLLDCSAMGIEPDNRRAYLIPYGKEATLIISYMGLIELIRRSGDVVSIRAETVCENDYFTWENGNIEHRIDWRSQRGNLQAVYAEALLKDGEKQTAVMTFDEVEAIRKKSKASMSAPWTDHFPEMAKKTVIRRLSKMMPLSYEIMDHISKDDNQFDGMRTVTPKVPVMTMPTMKPAEKETPTVEVEETLEAESVMSEDEMWGAEEVKP